MFPPNQSQAGALSRRTEIQKERIMRNRFAALALASALSFAPFAAFAQVVVPAGAELSADDARDIAAEQGIVAINQIDFDRDDNRWQIEGRDYQGRWVEMEIDANTGVVVEIDR
jgi:hypothetical protein